MLKVQSNESGHNIICPLGTRVFEVFNRDRFTVITFIECDPSNRSERIDTKSNHRNKIYPELDNNRNMSDCDKHNDETTLETPVATKTEESSPTTPPQVVIPESLKSIGTFYRFRGIFFAVLAGVVYSISAFTIKKVTVHPLTLGTFRFGLMAVYTMMFAAYANVKSEKRFGIFQDIPKMAALCLLVQGAVGATAMLFMFYGFQYEELGDSIVIATSSPVFVAPLAYLVLKEPCGYFSIITAVVAVIGVGIMSKPGIITGASDYDGNTMIGVGFNLASMCFLTVNYILLRHLRKVHFSLTQLFLSLFGALESAILGVFLGVLVLPKDPVQIGWIVANASLAFTAQTLITLALKFEEAGLVALIRTVEVPFCFLWEICLLHGKPDIYSAIGATITMTCVVLAALRRVVMALPQQQKEQRFLKLFLF